MMMLLLLAFICVGGAVFVVSEAVTYPARLKARSLRRATDYGRVRIPTSEREMLRFRERVLNPAAGKLASIPVKLNPRISLEALSARLVAAGLAQRLTAQRFLALKG